MDSRVSSLRGWTGWHPDPRQQAGQPCSTHRSASARSEGGQRFRLVSQLPGDPMLRVGSVAIPEGRGVDGRGREEGPETLGLGGTEEGMGAVGRRLLVVVGAPAWAALSLAWGTAEVRHLSGGASPGVSLLRCFLAALGHLYPQHLLCPAPRVAGTPRAGSRLSLLEASCGPEGTREREQGHRPLDVHSQGPRGPGARPRDLDAARGRPRGTFRGMGSEDKGCSKGWVKLHWGVGGWEACL